MEPVGLMAALLALGLLCNRAVEHFVSPFYDNIQQLESWKWTQQYWALAAGVVGAFVLNLDVVPAVLAQFEIASQVSPWGTALTGFVVGGGAELWHAVFDR